LELSYFNIDVESLREEVVREMYSPVRGAHLVYEAGAGGNWLTKEEFAKGFAAIVSRLPRHRDADLESIGWVARGAGEPLCLWETGVLLWSRFEVLIHFSCRIALEPSFRRIHMSLPGWSSDIESIARQGMHWKSWASRVLDAWCVSDGPPLLWFGVGLEEAGIDVQGVIYECVSRSRSSVSAGGGTVAPCRATETWIIDEEVEEVSNVD